MSIRKSLVDALAVNLLVQLVFDVTLLCGSDLRDAQRDAETISKRVHCEGFGFLSKHLPQLAKAVDKSLETGVLEVPSGFRSGRDSNIPVFLRGIFRLLYSEDGRLKDEDNSIFVFEALRGLRQILYFFYKVEVEYDDSCVSRFISAFIDTDRSLPEKVDLDETLWFASLYLEELFKDFDPRDVRPRHGPGSVATGERGARKYTFSRKYSGIHSYYPYYDYFVVGCGREIRDRLDWYKSLEPLSRGVAKLILVPKDSRGPRLISAEPLEYQWIQQGLGRKIVDHVESHPLTGGRVNFTDQTINQSLALRSSLSGKFATLDMKDASDRVSLALVRALFPDHLLEALEAARSAATLLPSGEEIDLRKFAPMGSSLCFPIEALTFWAICSAVCRQFSPGTNLHKRCYIYGDDIIVPTEVASLVIEALERYSLIVNRDKSYFKGHFRESCGVDAYKGFNVTPLKLRHPIWELEYKSRHVLYPHAVSAINSLLQRGYWRCAKAITELVESRMGPIPYGTARSSYPCFALESALEAEVLNRLFLPYQHRWNSDHQKWEFKFLRVISHKTRTPSFDGWNRLMRALVSPATGDPTVFPVRSTGLAPRWVSV